MSFNVSTSFRLDRGRIERMLHLPGGLVYRNMERRLRRVEAEAKRLAPGSMGDGIRVRVDRQADGDFRGVVTSTHPATIYVIYGTGIYGPTGRRIRPVRAQALRFVLDGRVVYATSVAGQKPNNFLVKALRAAL
jgi:hypothetical protein